MFQHAENVSVTLFSVCFSIYKCIGDTFYRFCVNFCEYIPDYLVNLSQRRDRNLAVQKKLKMFFCTARFLSFFVVQKSLDGLPGSTNIFCRNAYNEGHRV